MEHKYRRSGSTSTAVSALARGPLYAPIRFAQHMVRQHTPVTLGAPKFSSLEVGPFRVTEAHFSPNSRLQPHVHARNVLAILLEGSFDDVFPNQTLQCVPSTVLIEPAEDKHANRFGSDGARVLVVEPDPAHDELMHPCRDIFKAPSAAINPSAARIGLRLSHEVAAPDALTPLAVEGLVLELFVEATRRVSQGPHHAPVPVWLRRATDFLHDSFRQPLRIHQVAAVADVHPTHLARAFRTHHGTTVGSYVRRLRLHWTAVNLTNGESPISQIAVDAGFSDQSHFTRAFKTEFGVTPAQYRRRDRGDSRQTH